MTPTSSESHADDSLRPPCPNCGAHLSDYADFCPVCHQYLREEIEPWSWDTSKPGWYVALALVALTLGALWLAFIVTR